MNNIRNLLTACCFFLLNGGFAQDTTWFTNGLSIAGIHHYGREAIYTDKLAYQLYINALSTPVQGAVSGMTDDKNNPVVWQEVKADSLHRFRSRQFGGGYLYFSYNAPRERTALLQISGAGSIFFNAVPHAGDPYGAGWLYIPVKLKKGVNELYVRVGGAVTARIIFPKTAVQLNTEDATVPDIVAGSGEKILQAAVVVINSSDKDLKNLQISSVSGGITTVTNLPMVPRMSTRKCAFSFSTQAVTGKGQYSCVLTLTSNGEKLDEKPLPIEAVTASDKYRNTFTSAIDGSLQYYAVTPQLPAANGPAALFLSVHGAGVEAIGQAKAYQSKSWGNLVAATNRRPRGFNWEDWGRLDALEVLSIARKKFNPDPQHIYLTGHSMGGHGTWFLGAAYPDMWAGIAPCSGYPTLKEYGSADGAIPAAGATTVEQMLLRASNQSDVVKLASNYKTLGVYVLHGDSDKVVSVKYARQMRKILADFHTDMSYYEYPGGEHWFGDQSVDWPPLFDFFKWHSRSPDSSVNHIDFTTASPGISARFRWASVIQQLHPLQYSRLQLHRNLLQQSISGTTDNVRLLQLALTGWKAGAAVTITLDSLNTVSVSVKSETDSIFLVKENNQWAITGAPDAAQKGPVRYGTFKEPFSNRMLFIYGTRGNSEENEWSFNKARFDAETWYYRGNGSVDIIADAVYNSTAYAGRNIIIYGNASTNSVYNQLLTDCPLRVDRGRITAGSKSYNGDDLGAYFVWPLKNTPGLSAGVIAGTGVRGMRAVNANQYFAGASGFPDFMFFSLDMLKNGSAGIKMTGFFDQQWRLADTDIATGKE